jgi:hypothetical protein
MYLSELGYSELVHRLFEKMTFFLVDPPVVAVAVAVAVKTAAVAAAAV